jgi:hypothetical protein
MNLLIAGGGRAALEGALAGRELAPYLHPELVVA